MKKMALLLVALCAIPALSGRNLERTRIVYDVYQVYVCDSSLVEAEAKAVNCRNAKYLDHVSHCSCIGLSADMRDQIIKKTRCRHPAAPGPDGKPRIEWKEDTCLMPKHLPFYCNCVGNAQTK